MQKCLSVLILGVAMLSVSVLAGCSAEVVGHADTSGETVPGTVDLSPAAMKESGNAASPQAPSADAGVIGGPGNPR